MSGATEHPLENRAELGVVVNEKDGGHSAETYSAKRRLALPPLYAELPEVMIEVLVHQLLPLVRGERSEERVRMRGASGRTTRGESRYELRKPRLLAREFGLV